MANIGVNSLLQNGNSEETITERAKKVAGFTSRGTRIVKPGEAMDKNAFLRILSAELANQDPMNAKDGTEFVAQMAQFAGLEQMANLNTTMRLTGAVSFVNKYVMLNKLNMYGDLSQGLVTGISRDGQQIKINVLVNDLDNKGKKISTVKQFNLEDVIEVVNAPQENKENKENNNGNSLNSDKAI